MPEMKAIEFTDKLNLQPVNSWEDSLHLQERDKITEETIPMKQTWHGYSRFRIEAGEAKILIDPFLSDNPSRGNGWSGYLTGKNSTQGGDR